MSLDVQVLPDARAAIRAAAESFVAQARRAADEGGRFTVALTGGSAAEELYPLLATEPYRSAVPWDAVHLFWGDERCFPAGHPRSNYGLAYRAFIGGVPIPAANVHRMPGELHPEEGAAGYTRELASVFGPGVPRFDLIHLGVGPDAHTCSLFPFDLPLLLERERPVVPALNRPLGEWRITLTYPVVNAARRLEVLAYGARKAAVTRRAIRGPLDPFRLPIQGVRPTDGVLAWIVDPAAAAQL